MEQEIQGGCQAVSRNMGSGFCGDVAGRAAVDVVGMVWCSSCSGWYGVQRLVCHLFNCSTANIPGSWMTEHVQQHAHRTQQWCRNMVAAKRCNNGAGTWSKDNGAQNATIGGHQAVRGNMGRGGCRDAAGRAAVGVAGMVCMRSYIRNRIVFGSLRCRFLLHRNSERQ